MKKTITRYIIAYLLLAMVSACTAGVYHQPQTAQAAGKKATKAMALKAYKKFLSKKKITIKLYSDSKHGSETFDLTKSSFAVQDLNYDGVPELILDTMSEKGLAISNVVFTYYKAKVKYLDYTDHGDVWYSRKSHVYLNEHSNGGYTIHSFYQIKKGRAKMIAQETDNCGALGEDGKKEYFIGKKKVSQTKLKKHLKKYSKNSNIYKINKRKQPIYHKMTKSNIQKYCK